MASEWLVVCFTDWRALIASDSCDWSNEDGMQMGVRSVSCGIRDIFIHGFD